MVELAVWLVFGALAGWIVSLIMRTSAQSPRITANVLVGIAGALVGGMAAHAIADTSSSDLNGLSLIIALFSAVALVSLMKVFRKV